MRKKTQSPAPAVPPSRVRLPPIPAAIAAARHREEDTSPATIAAWAAASGFPPAEEPDWVPLATATADNPLMSLPTGDDLEPAVSSPRPTRQLSLGAATRAAPLFIAEDVGRRPRREARRAAHAIEAESRRAGRAVKQAVIDREKAERSAAQYLPRSGETGPAALRSTRRFTVPPHRATSEILAGAYPFLAEAGLGSEGLFIGQDAWSGSSFCYDPWVLYRTVKDFTNPNVLLAGVIGRGKSTLAKSLATRSIAFGRKVYVPGDPKGEWTPVAREVGGQAIELGPGLLARLNPLDEGPRGACMSDAEWLVEVTSRRRALLRSVSETALDRALRPVEATALFAALDAAVTANDVPLLPQVVEAMFRPSDEVNGSTVAQLVADGREVAHALNRLVGGDLGGLFDGPSTTRFDPSLPMVSLDLSRIQGSDQLIALVMTCSSAWMEAALADPAGGQRWVIYDEAWRLLRQPALLARMQSQWKLSRALGIANMMVIHRLSDLDSVGEANSEARNLALGLLADCSTKIIYAQEKGEAIKTANALGLSSTEAKEIPELERGEGLWRINEQAFVVRHVCTTGELTLFDTNARMGG
jgi:hypothetical protein